MGVCEILKVRMQLLGRYVALLPQTEANEKDTETGGVVFNGVALNHA